MQLAAKFGIGIIALGGGAISSAFVFLIIASISVVRGDPSGSGSGYAIAFFILIAPIVGAIGAIATALAVLLVVYPFASKLKVDLEVPLTTGQAFLWIFVSIIVGASFMAILMNLFFQVSPPS
jgi:hypothetical protein